MKRKLLCFIGYHTWRYKFSDTNGVVTNTPPDCAKCVHCGDRYKKEKPCKKTEERENN